MNREKNDIKSKSSNVTETKIEEEEMKIDQQTSEQIISCCQQPADP